MIHASLTNIPALRRARGKRSAPSRLAEPGSQKHHGTERELNRDKPSTTRIIAVSAQRTLARSRSSVPGESYGILSQRLFARSLYVERKRTERSGRGFVLMLLRSEELLDPQSDRQALEEIVLALSASSRDTDPIGWFTEGSTIGVIFTELGNRSGRSVVSVLRGKVTERLASALTESQMDDIALSFRVFPEDWEESTPTGGTHSILDMPLYETSPNGCPSPAKG